MDTHAAARSSPASSRGLARRLLLILLAPTDAYRGVVAHPRTAGALLVSTVLMCAAVTTFVGGVAGRYAMLRGTAAVLAAIGATEGSMLHGVVIGALMDVPFRIGLAPWMLLPPAVLGLAALAHTIGSASGTRTTAGQVRAVVAHALFVLALGTVFTVSLGIARGEPSLVRLPWVLIEAAPDPVSAVLRALDPFVLWWAANLGTGLGVLYGRPAGPIAGVLAAAYLLGLAAVAPLTAG